MTDILKKLNIEVDLFRRCRNLVKVLNAAKKVGISYLLIRPNEVISNDCEYDGWPAVWRLADICGWKSGCGNINQSQWSNEYSPDTLFPDEILHMLIDINIMLPVTKESVLPIWENMKKYQVSGPKTQIAQYIYCCSREFQMYLDKGNLYD